MVNINDRNCICTNLNFKRFYDRTCIQTKPQRLFEIKADRAERGQSRESCIYLQESKSSNRDIHGSKENHQNTRIMEPFIPVNTIIAFILLCVVIYVGLSDNDKL